MSKKAREIGEHFSVSVPPEYEGANYNAAPSQLLPVIAMNEPGSLQLFQWGLQPDWANATKGPSLVINARSESLHQKKMFADLFSRKRCLIPADGFYEWEKRGKTKQPWRFALKDESLFAFAGLFDTLTRPDGETMYAFTIITTSANELLEGIHERMPVMLDRQGCETWLSEAETKSLDELFYPYASAKMKSYKVSPKVNNAAINTPELISPWQDPNLTLF